MEKFRSDLQVNQEKATLVAAVQRGAVFNDDLAELTALAESAGALVVDRFQQKIRTIHPATYIGRGKAEQLAERVQQFESNVVIFDNDLSPAQIRELEKIIKVKVLDRSELILDIFASRAQTHQAKLQVDLAQLEYTYPRLTRMWSHLDTVAGGGGTAAGSVGAIGVRGTGEKQLEIDRRLVQKRITELKRELEQIDRRKMREIEGRRGIFTVGLVGYTNAGKSTLLNTLTDSDVYVEDQLFATLDTRTRKWIPENGVEILLSDTVGFVRRLPHQLVASFKATLEEAVNADLLLHVVDLANPEALDQIESVDKVLDEIGCGDKPTVMVLNKADAVYALSQVEIIQTLYPEAVTCSARNRVGLDELATAVLSRYRGSEVHLRVQSHHADGRIRSFLQAYGRILQEDYDDTLFSIEAVLGQRQLPGLKRLHPVHLEILAG